MSMTSCVGYSEVPGFHGWLVKHTGETLTVTRQELMAHLKLLTIANLRLCVQVSSSEKKKKLTLSTDNSSNLVTHQALKEMGTLKVSCRHRWQGNCGSQSLRKSSLLMPKFNHTRPLSCDPRRWIWWGPPWMKPYCLKKKKTLPDRKILAVRLVDCKKCKKKNK